MPGLWKNISLYKLQLKNNVKIKTQPGLPEKSFSIYTKKSCLSSKPKLFEIKENEIKKFGRKWVLLSYCIVPQTLFYLMNLYLRNFCSSNLIFI
jgi:hypothetical protein